MADVHGHKTEKGNKAQLSEHAMVGLYELLGLLEKDSKVFFNSVFRDKESSIYNPASSHSKASAIDLKVKDEKYRDIFDFFFENYTHLPPSKRGKNFNHKDNKLVLTEHGKAWLRKHNARLLDERGLTSEEGVDYAHFHLEFFHPSMFDGEYKEGNYKFYGDGKEVSYAGGTYAYGNNNKSYRKNSFSDSAEYNNIVNNLEDAKIETEYGTLYDISEGSIFDTEILPNISGAYSDLIKKPPYVDTPAGGVDLPIRLSKEVKDIRTLRKAFENLVETRDATFNASEDRIASDREIIGQAAQDFHKWLEGDMKLPILKGYSPSSHNDNKNRNLFLMLLQDRLGINKIDGSTADGIAEQRYLVNLAYDVTQGEEFGERIGGTQYIDSLFEDMTEDSMYTKSVFFKQLQVSEPGHISQDALKALYNDPRFSDYIFVQKEIDAEKDPSGWAMRAVSSLSPSARKYIAQSRGEYKFYLAHPDKVKLSNIDLTKDIGKERYNFLSGGFLPLDASDEELEQVLDLLMRNQLGENYKPASGKSANEQALDLEMENSNKYGYFKVSGEGGKFQSVYYTDGKQTLTFGSLKELGEHMKKTIGNTFQLEDLDNYIQTYSPEELGANNMSIIDDVYASSIYVPPAPIEYEDDDDPEDDKKITPTGNYYNTHLMEGIYKSDDYNPDGDEAGYTGIAKKVKVPGKTFDPNDPSTFTWHYEKLGQLRNDGNIVPGTENEKYWVQAGEIDENAYSAYTVDDEAKEVMDESSADTLSKVNSTLAGLKAGAGIIELGQALKDIPIQEVPELSDAFKAYMNRARQLSETGLTAKEKTAALNDLSNAYQLGAKNVLRASGGSRGTFLANMGMLNANRVNGLIKLGAIDAATQRENLKHYGEALKSQELLTQRSGELSAKMAYDESKRKSDLHGTVGATLIGSAISDMGYAMEKRNQGPYMEQLLKLLQGKEIFSEQTTDKGKDPFYFIPGEND